MTLPKYNLKKLNSIYFNYYPISTYHANKMYHLTTTTRTYSSGSESRNIKSFETLEEVAKYIQDEWYDEFCQDFEFPGEWDEEDMGCAFPKKTDMTFDIIKAKMEKKRSLDLLNAYSQYAALVPYEVTILRS